MTIAMIALAVAGALGAGIALGYTRGRRTGYDLGHMVGATGVLARLRDEDEPARRRRGFRVYGTYEGGMTCGGIKTTTGGPPGGLSRPLRRGPSGWR